MTVIQIPDEEAAALQAKVIARSRVDPRGLAEESCWAGLWAISRCARKIAGTLSLLRHHDSQNVVDAGRVTSTELPYPLKHVGIQSHGHQLLRGASELRQLLF